MKENAHAQGNEGGSNLPSDQAQDGRQGKGGADRAVANGLVVGDGQAAEVTRAKGKRTKAPRASDLTPRTESDLKEAIRLSAGDLFLASEYSRLSPIRLKHAIELSPALQTALELSRKHAGTVLPPDVVNRAIEDRLAVYRVAGLDALNELATMPISRNSAQNQVKLAAAARLAGSPEGSGGSDEFSSLMRDLNQSYQENAPRLRVTRERLVVETVPAEKVIQPERK